jgi:hypothetical protein
MGVQYWIVDYDIPVESPAKRRAFYRALHVTLKAHNIVADRSTQSVWIIDSKEIAEQIHRLASRYGVSHLYSARKVQ